MDNLTVDETMTDDRPLTIFDPRTQEKFDPDAITVVFTNNAAAEKVLV